VTDQEEMVTLLNEHWKEVFKAKEIQEEHLNRWFDEAILKKTDTIHADFWLEDVEKLMGKVRCSLPGPNGIPFTAYRKWGKVFAPFILKLLFQMMDTQSGLGVPDWFNEVFLFLIPKKPDWVSII
jgi:hypothetical protein